MSYQSWTAAAAEDIRAHLDFRMVWRDAEADEAVWHRQLFVHVYVRFW